MGLKIVREVRVGLAFLVPVDEVEFITDVHYRVDESKNVYTGR